MRQFIVAKPIVHEGENRFGVVDSASRRRADQLLGECGDGGGIGQRLALNAGDHRRVFIGCGRGHDGSLTVAAATRQRFLE